MRFILLLGFSEATNKTKIFFSWGGSVLVGKSETVKNRAGNTLVNIRVQRQVQIEFNYFCRPRPSLSQRWFVNAGANKPSF